MSTGTSERAPIWAHPEPGSRRPRLTREQIAAAAVAIADAEGFEAVSMRRIAHQLGVGTMTLYYYLRTRDDLLALVDDALMGEVVVPERELPRQWRAALTAIARRTRAMFARHPWALEAMLGAPPGPNGMRHFEQCLAALESTGMDQSAKFELLAVVDDFVFGHALRTGAALRHGRPSAKARKASLDYAKRELATGRYPHTAALFEGIGPTAAEDRVVGVGRDDERFERGLQALLDAAETRVGSRPPVRPGRSR
jgi:AcrR family transcriptional regulator